MALLGAGEVGSAQILLKSGAQKEKMIKPGQDLFENIKTQLDPQFGLAVEKLFDRLLSEGIVMRPFSGLRGPLEQGILWSQSRTPLERELMARKLEDERATFLAKVLRRAGTLCTAGRWATNNLPGQSWHNFGLAIDSHVVSEDGRAVWGPKHVAYSAYASIARELGLFPGYDLAKQDVIHIQGPNAPVRLLRGSWPIVDRELERMFPADAGS